MHPQLLYVYIKDIGRAFEDQSFTLTNDFQIDYIQGKLTINMKENPYDDLWGENINNINLIVGKNGAGKTTLLELLGSTELRRSRLFEQPKWFALYFLEANTFVIEGNQVLPRNVSGISTPVDKNYSISVKYNYKTQNMQWDNYIHNQMYLSAEGKETLLNESLRILYQPKEADRLWLKNLNVLDGKDNTNGFKRSYLNKPTFSSLYRFMSNEYSLLEDVFTFDQAEFEISQHVGINPNISSKYDMFNILGFALYQDQLDLLFFSEWDSNSSQRLNLSSPKWANKDKFILVYLEALIIDFAYRSSNYPASDGYSDHIDLIHKELMEKNTYQDRKSYLLKILNILGNTIAPKLKKHEAVDFNVDIFTAIIIALEEIEPSLFESHATIRIPVSGGIHHSVEDFLKIYDRFFNRYGVSYSLDISYKFLSSGEMDFIRAFSSLHDMINMSLEDKKAKSVLLIMDEPDVSFHPEWSRQYIYYLTRYISKISIGSDIHYQILFSTHSPFIVSDIPKEHITCINILYKEEKLYRIVKAAEFGLMSNFYDIVKSDFFLGAPMGAFAKQLFSDLMKRMNDWTEYDSSEIKKVRTIIAGIGEAVIRIKLQSHLEAQVNRIQANMNFKDEVRIAELEKELEQLKEKRGGKSND